MSALPVLQRPGCMRLRKGSGVRDEDVLLHEVHATCSPTAAEVRAGTPKPEEDKTLASLTWALHVKNKTEDCAGPNYATTCWASLPSNQCWKYEAPVTWTQESKAFMLVVCFSRCNTAFTNICLAVKFAYGFAHQPR